MDAERPGYYAIIPADVRYDDRIPANAKLLYGEISALIGADGFCYASNQYFAKIYGLSVDSVTRLFKALEDNGYIKREIEKDRSGQVVRRKIFLSVSVPQIQPPDNFTDTPPQKRREGTRKKDGYTNTSITDKKESKKKKESDSLTDEQLWQIVRDQIAAQPNMVSWPRETKNQIHKLVMEVYDPNRDVRKSHPMRTERSVDLLFTNLQKRGGSSPDAVIGLLSDVIQNGWQNVSAPKGKVASVQVKPPAEERRYQCV